MILDIKGIDKGPKIALRADIDALPMQENNKTLEYKSITQHAHMCGHDGHTVILLGVAAELKQHSFKGSIRLIWQPAEE